MEISAGFQTSLDTPSHIVLAEDLGYRRAWCYDTPQQSPDVWMVLALAAQRTQRIGLGPGVLIPTLRHPMVNASGAAALEAMAPGRVAVGFGTGFSGRRAMGEKKPVPWAYVRDYIGVFRALLRGETADWEGAALRMLHPADSAPARPIDLPIVVGALGPKGHDVAKEYADGLFATTVVPEGAGDFSWVAFLCWGTVLDDGEDWGSQRVRRAAGPGAMLAYHATYELNPAAVATLPGGPEWLAVVEQAPEHLRHFTVHQGHCFAMNDADDVGWAAGGQALVEQATMSGRPADVRAKIDALADQGVTEIVYQPVGDVGRELASFAAAAGL